jgi:hypothetical protein
MRKTSRDRNEEEQRSATTAIEVFEARGGQTPQCSIPSGFRRATFLKRNRYAFLGPNRRESPHPHSTDVSGSQLGISNIVFLGCRVNLAIVENGSR